MSAGNCSATLLLSREGPSLTTPMRFEQSPQGWHKKERSQISARDPQMFLPYLIIFGKTYQTCQGDFGKYTDLRRFFSQFRQILLKSRRKTESNLVEIQATLLNS